jgi:uncharacterized ferredoxin-like protein
MILNERESRHEHVLHVARQMMTAARTAPKGKGVDIIEIAMVTDGDINILSEMMVKMVAEHGMKFFLRDAENILNAECVLLIGTHEQAQGLNCVIVDMPPACLAKKECRVLSIVSMWALPSDQLVPRQQTTGWTHGSCSRPD